MHDDRPDRVQREIRTGLRAHDDGRWNADPMREPGALEQDIARQVIGRVFEREVPRGDGDRDIDRERDPERVLR